MEGYNDEENFAEEINLLRDQVKTLRRSNWITTIGLAVSNIIFLERYLRASAYYQQIYEWNQQIILKLQQLFPLFQKIESLLLKGPL